MSISSIFSQAITKSEIRNIIEHALFEEKISIVFYEEVLKAIELFKEDEDIDYKLVLDKI